MTEWAHGRTGMDLHPGAQIGTHFFVDHCTGTVVGETGIIGDHVKMYQGVGLVARSLAAGQPLRGKSAIPPLRITSPSMPGATIMGGDTVVWRRQHDRRERLSDHQCSAPFARRPGRGQRESLE